MSWKPGATLLAARLYEPVILGEVRRRFARPGRLGELLDRASDLFDCTAVEETTLEANPDDLSGRYLDTLRRAGVDRLSIGIQSLDEECLRLMNRRHTAAQAVEAVGNARKAGFDNLSVDLISVFRALGATR